MKTEHQKAFSDKGGKQLGDKGTKTSAGKKDHASASRTPSRKYVVRWRSPVQMLPLTRTLYSLGTHTTHYSIQLLKPNRTVVWGPGIHPPTTTARNQCEGTKAQMARRSSRRRLQETRIGEHAPRERTPSLAVLQTGQKSRFRTKAGPQGRRQSASNQFTSAGAGQKKSNSVGRKRRSSGLRETGLPNGLGGSVGTHQVQGGVRDTRYTVSTSKEQLLPKKVVRPSRAQGGSPNFAAWGKRQNEVKYGQNVE